MQSRPIFYNGGIEMFNKRFFDYYVLKLSAVTLHIFSLVLIINAEILLTGISLLLFSLYLALFAWHVLERSHVAYISFMILFAVCVFGDKGFSKVTVFTVCTYIVSMYFVHYFVVRHPRIGDDSHN